MVDLKQFNRVPQPIEVGVPSTTAIEAAILSAIAGLSELKDKVNANDVARTTKQNAMVTAVETAINDLYSKLEAIGDMSATDLENLQATIKTANDIVSNGVNGLVKAIDSILQVLNSSKNIEFLDGLVDGESGAMVIDLPVAENQIFRVGVTALNKPHNAQETVSIIVDGGVTKLKVSYTDLSHFASAKVPFNATNSPIELSITLVKDRVDLLSFEIEKPTETLEDEVTAKDTVKVGNKE